MQRSRHQIRAALRHLLVLLDNADVLFSTHVPNAVEEELRRFGEYMEHARGLAENTRIQRLNILRPFLRKNGSANRHKWTAPTAADLRRFITLKLQRWSPASANALAGALRCYLRFRAMCGDPVGHLLPAIASPANWRLAPLPQTLSQIQVTQLLDSFSPDLPSALRAYAMVRCVVDLGPRASEVVSLSEALHLCDTDVDLQGATLTIRQTKFNKSRCLPVQQSVVQALADYRQLRDHAVARSVNMPFFVSSKGSGLLKHTVDYVFGQLRDRLRWHPRGEHPHPRIQDLRHYAERRIMPNNR